MSSRRTRRRKHAHDPKEFSVGLMHVPLGCSTSNYLELVTSKLGPRPKKIMEYHALIEGGLHPVSVFASPPICIPGWSRRPIRGAYHQPSP